MRTSWGTILNGSRKVVSEFPFEMGLWYPSGGITTSKTINKCRVLIQQWIPAYIVDGILTILGKKRL